MKLIINGCVYDLHGCSNITFNLLRHYFSLLIFSDKTNKISLDHQGLFWVPKQCNKTEANQTHKILEEFCNSIMPSGMMKANNTVSQALTQKSKTSCILIYIVSPHI